MIKRGFLFRIYPCDLSFVRLGTNPFLKIIIFLLLKYNMPIIENVEHRGKSLKAENKDVSKVTLFEGISSYNVNQGLANYNSLAECSLLLFFYGL